MKLTTKLTHITREQELCYMKSWIYVGNYPSWKWHTQDFSHVSISWKDWIRSIDILKKEKNHKKKNKHKNNSRNMREYISYSHIIFYESDGHICLNEFEYLKNKIIGMNHQYVSRVLFKKYRKDIMLQKNKSFRNIRKNMRGKKLSR